MSTEGCLEMVKKIFRVTDMHCSNCAMRLQELEDILPGVKSVAASYHRQQMVVEYDEAKTNPVEIVTAAKGLGYTAVPQD
jgi:copper chaperone CopZ